MSDINRVSEAIGGAISDFVASRRALGMLRFHMADLTNWIGSRGITCAPDSPGRILRQKRKAGAINYTLVDRSSSLYELA